MQPTVILFDIETAPNISLTWGIWEQDVIEVIRPWYILSFAWKVLGEEKIHCVTLPDLNGYEQNRESDFKLCKKLHDVMSKADILVSHNGQAFDVKKAMARFAFHNMKPPTMFKQIDTLLMARTSFKFDSNKLDDLASFLNIGRKLPHVGKKMWIECSDAGKHFPESWAAMAEYNRHDVWLLEEVYLRLRPFARNHPRLDYYTRRIGEECPTCQSPRVKLNGGNMTKSGKSLRMRCKDCGASWNVGKVVKAA
jgi:hypothetical protein